MQALSEMNCEACRVDAPRVASDETRELLKALPEWKLVYMGGIATLERVFTFKEYSAGLAFSQHIGELAIAEDHHPKMVIEWGRVTVQWWTHKIRGLHRNDFIMAAKTDTSFALI